MPKSWWILLGNELSERIVDHTKNKGLDVFDRKFKKLSDKDWVDKKGRVIFKSYKKRKAAGEIARVGPNSEANLWATGDMLSDLKTRRATDKSVVVGWGAFESEKLLWNQNGKPKRVVTTQKKPIARSVEKSIQKLIDKQTQKNIAKNNTVNRIKLGR